MPKYQAGDIIEKTSQWGTTTALILDINTYISSRSKTETYYKLLYISTPYELAANELRTNIVDKRYSLKV